MILRCSIPLGVAPLSEVCLFDADNVYRQTSRPRKWYEIWHWRRIKMAMRR
nr:hypothetical protein [uncultured bacterium]